MLQRAFLGPLALAAACSAAGIVTTDFAPLIGPSYLTNFDPTKSETVKDAISAFPEVVEKLFSADVINSTDLVFGIDVFSAATNESLYSYFHVGEGLNKTLTAGTLNDRTISRTGSVSKLFTAYAILAKAGFEVFSHPVTRYIPELAGNSSDDPLENIRWEDITVGALASHQAGTGGAGGLFLSGDFTGFEDVADLEPECKPDTTLPRHFSADIFLQVLFQYMRTKHPVISPFRNAVYSDGGYSVLGQVLARLSGQSYEDAMRDILFEPLGLDDSSVKAPTGSDLNAINRKPVDVNSSWAGDIPILAGSGGIYSSLADLRTVGLSILNSELVSPADTQEWMKPLSGTGSLVSLVGAPWEIARLMIPVTPNSNRTRVSDLYTKAGGNGDYTCILALSPDHGIGYSILVAGSTASSARWPLRDATGEVFIPAFEHAAVANAEKNLAGTFVAEGLEGTNLTLTVDEGKPGLGLKSVFIQGNESLPFFLGTPEPLNVTARLYPNGLNSYSRSLASLYKTKGKMRVAHRAIVQATPLAPRTAVEGGKGGLFDNSFSWSNLDFALPLDEFILEIEDGKVVSLTSSAVDFFTEKKVVLKPAN
ncbi:hypothetical protein FALBO_186 [Fusarium albosuccineum]|uniref:Beta-lactamase-related domain-containing protein n=1 Tax=Fusarium albosuccineum TaxID=1237068 RepID=A0A8H4LRI5_9HYPO|nr:hypothetical protein FALBO_186 [Fusarium albosuccineum]